MSSLCRVPEVSSVASHRIKSQATRVENQTVYASGLTARYSRIANLRLSSVGGRPTSCQGQIQADGYTSPPAIALVSIFVEGVLSRFVSCQA